MKYKLIVSDVDGVWTDGSFYYSEEGDVQRKFNTRDSYGVSLCRIVNVPVLILSTEANEMVLRRMEKLKLKHVKLGVRNKFQVIKEYCDKFNISPQEVAYVGDDMNDYHLIGKLGFFGCPANAYYRIKERADIVLKTDGGAGAFREFVELLIKKEGNLEGTYEKYTKECLGKLE